MPISHVSTAYNQNERILFKATVKKKKNKNEKVIKSQVVSINDKRHQPSLFECPKFYNMEALKIKE